jgi:anti-sigma regulatory factor (Ser/Thr protein kinase)
LELELAGTPDSVAEARRALGGLATGIAADRLGDVRLLVSELVTNAVRHAGVSAGEMILLSIALDDARLRVEVQDSGGGFTPAVQEPDPARASGWGLYLVEELADRWGVERGAATRVWFELDRPAG